MFKVNIDLQDVLKNDQYSVLERRLPDAAVLEYRGENFENLFARIEQLALFALPIAEIDDLKKRRS